MLKGFANDPSYRKLWIIKISSQLSLENAVVSHVYEECESPYPILEYLAGGMTEAEILADFDELTSADIKACLAFAADREKKLFVALR
jgi:Protein of unknown function (DUF433)